MVQIRPNDMRDLNGATAIANDDALMIDAFLLQGSKNGYFIREWNPASADGEYRFFVRIAASPADAATKFSTDWGNRDSLTYESAFLGILNGHYS